MSKAAKNQEKQEWAIEKRKLDNARKLTGIFIDPEDEEDKETIKKGKKETRNSFGSDCALQDGDKKESVLKELQETVAEWRHSPTQENQVCLYCGSSRIHKEAFGVYSSEKS